jgi:hypothetical protein
MSSFDPITPGGVSGSGGFTYPQPGGAAGTVGPVASGASGVTITDAIRYDCFMNDAQ